MESNLAARPQKLSGQALFLVAAIVLSAVVAVGLVFVERRGPVRQAEAAVAPLRLEDIPFNGARAYDDLKQLCAIGPRRSGSLGMAEQQKLLAEHFRKVGGQVEFQRFRAKDPVDGSDVHMANLIVRWEPERRDRVLVCGHYATLPFPLRDPVDRKGRFVGANDNASGVAILMELGREMAGLTTRWGVDFVFLDGEEYIFDEQQRFFLGSEFFARNYAESRPAYRYRWGVLLDMVGGADLKLYQERHGLVWEDTRALVDELWTTASRLGVREFIAAPKWDVRDDHLMLHDLGGIPACDLIDFDYPPWHTRGDTPDKCSALSLAKVGWVIRQWLTGGPSAQ